MMLFPLGYSLKELRGLWGGGGRRCEVATPLVEASNMSLHPGNGRCFWNSYTEGW